MKDKLKQRERKRDSWKDGLGPAIKNILGHLSGLVMIRSWLSQFVKLSPTLASVLTVQGACLWFYLPLPRSNLLSLKINKFFLSVHRRKFTYFTYLWIIQVEKCSITIVLSGTWWLNQLWKWWTISWRNWIFQLSHWTNRPLTGTEEDTPFFSNTPEKWEL